MKKFFILLLCIISFFQNYSYGEEPFSLLSMINISPVGSYVVLENNQTCIVLILKEKKEKVLILHEMFFSKNSFKSSYNWKQCLYDNSGYFAKFETIIEENFIKTSPIVYKKNKKISKEQIYSFASLLNSLSFSPVSEKNVKMTKDVFNVPIPWKPKLTVEGNSINYSSCISYEAYWPKDESYMSNKRIEIYLPLVKDLNFLYFPIWLEVESPLGNIKIRAIDSGILDKN